MKLKIILIQLITAFTFFGCAEDVVEEKAADNTPKPNIDKIGPVAFDVTSIPGRFLTCNMAFRGATDSYNEVVEFSVVSTNVSENYYNGDIWFLEDDVKGYAPFRFNEDRVNSGVGNAFSGEYERGLYYRMRKSIYTGPTIQNVLYINIDLSIGSGSISIQRVSPTSGIISRSKTILTLSGCVSA